MKLFFLLLLSVSATNLRKVSEHSDCEICVNLYERVRNSSFSSIESLKTKARLVCHDLYRGSEEITCLDMTNDATSIAENLFSDKPNGCEISGYCADCSSCGQDCIKCRDTCYITKLFKRFWNM